MSASARSPVLALHGIHADVWHAHAMSQTPQQVLATGDAVLDAQLPGGGWPIGALIEILQPTGLHSEWRLLLPALAQCGPEPVVLVGAPHVPFAPALAAQGLVARRLLQVQASAPAMRLWAAEQALRCADVSAVLAWLPQARADALRRLQMAAAEYSKLLFVMRSASAQAEASPAALRLQVKPCSRPAWPDGIEVGLLKRRGPPLDQPLHLGGRTARMNLLLAAGRINALDRTATPA